MKKTLIALLMLLAGGVAKADNFTNSTFQSTSTWSYPNAYSAVVNISYQVGPLQPGDYYRLGSIGGQPILQSAENPNQFASVYMDAAMTQRIPDNGSIDITANADGTVHSTPLYIKFYSQANQNAISAPGTYHWTTNLNIWHGQGTVATATLNITGTATASCGFLQNGYNFSKSISVGSVAKGSSSITYNCSTGLSPTLSASATSYTSTQDPSITMNLFSDSGYNINLGATPLALTANSTNKTVTIYPQFYQNGSTAITKVGIYDVTGTLIINY
ncbi:spore coat protein U domain-containing protein [Burkholderia contaminans]|uniref:spore coat protein U domain-containing protein n=1 Tax=Burkholderia contaminans TaxID=488447 RepID=UPI00158C0B2E|nr:spore coat protein U domain-containing protein [Burkholderia contaminans]